LNLTVRQIAGHFSVEMKSTPAKKQTACERVEARVSRDLKQLFQRAADLQGITLSDFIISSSRKAALQTVEEQHVIKLSVRDSRRFLKALISPGRPNAKLRAALRRHRQITGI
jgi:uncharacterized protein (DUF1778 family)